MSLYHGKTALITGASSGIGESFARQLAAQGMNVILVARSTDKLEKLSIELKRLYGVRTESIGSDLSQARAADEVHQAVKDQGLTVDLLINNAGFGTYGAFEEQSAEREHEEVMLNVAAVVALTHAFLPDMVAHGDGAIINIASIAAFQPTPYMAVYGATKAFVLAFSNALWAEYRRRNIRVLAVCPGPTATKFFDVAGSEDAAVGTMRDPDQVVTGALRALERKRSIYVDGLQNMLQAQATRLMPRALLALLVERMLRPQPERKPMATIADPTTA